VVNNGLGAPRLAAQVYGLFFRRHGYRVYTVPHPPLNFGDIRRSAARAGELVEQVRARHRRDRVPLVGLSLGGLIGLYYVRCGGGAATIDRFVSVGGPLNGSPLARIGARAPLSAIPALRQSSPDSDVIAEIAAAGPADGVRIHALGTVGDPITPRESWSGTGLDAIETPHGAFPVGHWYLYVHPGNYREVLRLLRAP
jgi:triacylglycerol esterase/lipase EstA (alpha/beta hydrolase family)